ncbi:zinc finger protein 721 [Kryptolebias marmoratus]|uniref:Zinc finger protein 721-like n=1 Tax=Kryptolebias marmoratus TaxID=37003 RepID=A0A3Q3ARI1_KRYMA|nr:zinc finger protein 721 [Kryptolebias marmoratus]XP_017288748.1 zinc finger protein 721 [Kryptolebias marmoratus]XP_017288750.1 zinc finger protein 721 [Kryptolebias marmoratus]XP_017288751.1 zinc finger protein 721 [Kryptolebias marmoratus]XP_024865634.1 zinc finger protein 721 [Kryptolebias marmoratus]
MPSAHRQNNLIMERRTTVNNVASAQLSGESSAFICAECGDGFSQYSNVLTHMVIHGPLESFSFDGSSYGFEIPREYVLQENGTLTAVNGLPQSHSSNSPVKPVSPGVLPSHLPLPVRPLSPTSRSQPSLHKDAFKPRPSDLNLDKSRHSHYRCEICNRSFNSLQSLHFHQQYRNTGRGYRCTLCCKTFEDGHDLKKHLQNHINEQFNYCGHCGKRFLRRDALNAHQKENHSLSKALGETKEGKKMEKAYTCKKCKLSFFWMSDFQIHSVYYCKGQEPDAVSLSDLEMEVDSKDPEDMHFVNCHSNGTFEDVKNGDGKFSMDTNSESDLKPTFTPYRCGLCGDRFEKLSDLKEHHLTHQTQEEIDRLNQESQKIFKRRLPPKGRRSNPNGKLHPCKHCHRVFNHSSSLSRHMRYHKGTMHNCTFCGRLFPQRCDLRRHVVMYHKAELEKKPALKHLYTNPQNGPSSDSVDVEKSIDTPDENTKDSSNNEQTSMEKSPKDKQSGKAVRGKYKCYECGKKFGLLCVYQRHLRYHKKEPNKCPQCPAQFKNVSSLELHLQNHPNIENADDGIGQTFHETGTDPDKALEKDNAEYMEDDYVDQKQTDKGNSSDALYECT